MGAYLFYVVCVAIWLGFGWALLARPVVLDRAWSGVRRLPLMVKPVVWVAFLPWLSGLAIWESGWRTSRVRRIAVVIVALSFIVFWSLVTFSPGGEG
jgi:membrane protease YdiL (CAAX protease family)